MSKGQNPTTPTPTDPPFCGDCRMPLDRPEKQSCEPDEFYCPVCAKPANEPVACPHCRSLVCPRCGTPLEAADDLGIG